MAADGEPSGSSADGPGWVAIQRAIQVIGAGAALIGWIVVVGGARVYLRYQDAGLPSPLRTVSIVPRNTLLAEGLKALAVPLGAGGAIALVAYAVLRTLETRRQALDRRFGARYHERTPSEEEAFKRYSEWRRLNDERELAGELTAIGDRVRKPRDSSGRKRWRERWRELPRYALPLAAEIALAALVVIALFSVTIPGWIVVLVVALIAVAILFALRRSATAAQYALALFAAVVVVAGLGGVVQKDKTEGLELNPVRAILKEPDETVRGLFVARSDDDLFLAQGLPRTPSGEVRRRLKVIPLDRVVQVFVGPETVE